MTRRVLIKYRAYFFLLVGLSMVLPCSLQAQKMTKVRGVVLDAKTGEPIPFAAVSFKNKNIGGITDYNGAFSLESNFASDALIVSSLGYEPTEIPITLFDNNFGLKIRLRPVHVELETIDVVTTKKRKYKNKGNPAVELIKQVIANKKNNRLTNFDSYSVQKYQKVELDINNITQRFMNNPMFNNLQEIFNYVDTSSINGKPFLPVYMYETIADVYYRKDPNKYREWILASQAIGFEKFIDGQGLSAFIQNIYQEVDIYDNSILFLEKEFTSPISSIAPAIYRYYILDTLAIEGVECIELGFMPRNDADYSFKGKIWISADSTYAVKQVELGVTNKININWINTFLIQQTFEFNPEFGMLLSESHTTIDFDLAVSDEGTGIYGKKSDYFSDYAINISLSDSVMDGNEITYSTEGCFERDSAYWNSHRKVELTRSEKQISVMSDHIQNLPSFNLFVKIVNLFISGYFDFGPVEVGPAGSFYSFNEIEGFRFSLGFRTTEALNYHWEVGGRIAYGLNDEEIKYGGHLKYYWDRRKKNYLTLQYQREYYFPGQVIDFVRADNLFFSFRRGVQDKMIDQRLLDVEFSHEFSNDYRIILNGKTGNERGLGTLQFIEEKDGEFNELEFFSTYEFGFKQRFTPNQKFYTGKNSRSVIITNHPVYELTYKYGQSIDQSIDFNYHKLNARFFKRNNMGKLGYNDVLIEAEKTFGKGVPFLYLRMHAANQSYTFQEYSANMMNYLEFVSDQYVYFIMTHYFDGLFFNQIPLLKRLKWRSLVSGRVLYGGVTDPNNPDKTSGLVQFPTDGQGQQTTFIFDEKPYVEVSIGIENILNLFRIDLVKRITYLDNPNLPDLNGVRGLGIRFKARINF